MFEIKVIIIMNNFQAMLQFQNLINGDRIAMDENEIIYKEFFEDSSSSEESSEETHYINIKNFMQIIDLYSHEDFKSHFRLQRSTIEYLISSYSQSTFVANLQRGGRTKLGQKKEMYIFIWYISNIITFRQLGNLFGVPKSSAWIAVNRVCRYLVSVANQHIKWPQGSVVRENCRKFEQKKRIPRVIGAIDCTHISIAAPKTNKHCYYNRKHQFTINLQATVDADKKFIDICCGEPGSLHDSRVLRRSELFRKAQENPDRLFPYNTFILGDSAYSSTNWLVTPYRDNGRLTAQQHSFNYLHSGTRIVVEHAFGLLKGRFRRLLKFTEQRNLRSVTNLVISACVLHNICITMDDEFADVNQETENGHEEIHFENHEGNALPNQREDLFNYLAERNVI